MSDTLEPVKLIVEIRSFRVQTLRLGLSWMESPNTTPNLLLGTFYGPDYLYELFRMDN